jgi:hypothetical protein
MNVQQVADALLSPEDNSEVESAPASVAVAVASKVAEKSSKKFRCREHYMGCYHCRRYQITKSAG